MKNNLSKLKMNKADGIDQISTRMLLELSEEFSSTMSELFNEFGSLFPRLEVSKHYRCAWGRCRVGHGPPKILVGWATMHLAPPIIGLYVR